MSKTTTTTTTVAYAKYGNESEERSRHHLINWGLGNHTSKHNNHQRNSVNINAEQHRGRGNPEMNTNAGRNEGSKSRPARKDEKKINKSQKPIGRIEVFKGNGKSPSHSPKNREHGPDMRAIFASRGIDYDAVRRNSRIQYCSEETGLYYDTWKPPKEFATSDMPDFISLPTKEEAVSPAIVIARMQMQDKSKIQKKSPDQANCELLLNKFKSKKPKGNHHEQDSSDEKDVPNPPTSGFDNTFPDDESLNDSFMVNYSQQVEEKDDSRDARKRDINGKGINQFTTSAATSSSKSTPIPLSSTPLAAHLSMAKPSKDNDTPKGTRSSRSRHRSITKSVGKDIFETSVVDTQLKPEFEDHPRKLFKFEGSPSPIKGEFDDDDEDDMFSQIAMPIGETSFQVPKFKANLTDGDMETFTPEMLGEIDKLEELGIQSSSSMSMSRSSAPSSTERTYKKDVRKISSRKIQETPKTGSKRLGLSRARR